jgi:hypothetical protein
MLYMLIGGAVFLGIIFAMLKQALRPVIIATRVSRRLKRDGVDAEAVLLRIEPMRIKLNQQTKVKMLLYVQPLSGRNFVTHARDVLDPDDLARLNIGSRLKVKYNPADIKEIMVTH